MNGLQRAWQDRIVRGSALTGTAAVWSAVALGDALLLVAIPILAAGLCSLAVYRRRFASGRESDDFDDWF